MSDLKTIDISPQLTEWLIEVPIDTETNLKYRALLIEEAEGNPELQQLIIKLCRDSFEFYIDSFCWTYDPREPQPHKPFILWPAQRDFLRWFEVMYERSQRGEKVNIGIDKPRAVGLTYTIMVWVDWKYKFHEFSARVGSRKEDYVDKKGDPDTLFYKLDYQNDRQPEWLTGKHNRAYMSIRPAGGNNPNSIIGESANPNFSRGGRKNMVLFDEFGFWDYAKSSWESTGESTNFRVALSTPPENGKDSHMNKLLTNKAGKVYVYEFDWTADPRRDDAWLEEAKATKSEEEFAREVLKSYEGTTEGKVYAITMRRSVLSNIDYNPRLPIFISWDFGLDAVSMLWLQKDMQSNKVNLIDCYENHNKEIDFYVPFVNGIIQSQAKTSEKYTYTEYELEIIERHLGWAKTVTHFGDPDVRKRNLINKESVKSHLRDEHQIYVQSIPWGGRTWNDMKAKTDILFRRLEINESRCEPAISAFRNAKYPTRRESSQAQNEASKPIHDWTSHYRTALEYFADNEPGSLDVKTVVAGTSNVQGKAPEPHEIEKERNRREKDKIAGINRQVVRTVLSGTESKVSPNRVI